MKILRQFAFGTLAVLFIALSAVMSFAGDPPSRVARLKYISGEVSMQPGGVNDWVAATINRPMTTADRLWTDRDSRAELHLGSAAMRMNSETSLTLTNLSDNTVQLELDEGALNLQVARMFHGEIYEVDTPNTAFTILKPGNYRFDVDSNGDTTVVTVWKGKGVATGNGHAVRIESRHQVRFMGGMSLAHATFKAPRFDGFDQWCQVRAERESRAVSVRYVSPDVVGYEDLGEYGYWREVPSYGAVWFPTRVEVGWAPYRYGHWIWVEPWGWTWVDDAPWGFAPFHYGRWVSVAGVWAWAPGPVAVRPCYAPALVAWVGSSGVGVGWFPLGYGEPYLPHYRASRGYFETVNVSNTRITNITYVTNNYYNVNSVRITNIHYVHETNGITVVNNEVLVNSRRVDNTVIIDHDRDRDWREHHDAWIAAGPPVAPSHRAVLGIHADRTAPEPPERVHNGRVVVNVAPPYRPVPFDSKHVELEDHHGRPLDSFEEDRLRRRQPEQDRPLNQNGHGQSASSEQWADDRHPDDRAYENRRNGARHDEGPRSDDRDHRNSVADDRRDYPSSVHRPSRRDDEDQSHPIVTGGYYPDQHQYGQNPHGRDDQQQRADDNRNPRYGNPNSGNRQSDDVYAGRQFPHLPRHGDDDRGQSASAGPVNPDSRQQQQNPNVGNDDQNSSNSGMPRRNGPDWNRPQVDDTSAGRQFPRPQRTGPERARPEQSDGAPAYSRGDDRQLNQPSYGGRGQSPEPSQPAVHEAQSQRGGDFGTPRLPAQPTEARPYNSPINRPVPQAVYNERNAPTPAPQQAAQPMPRPVQADRSDSRPAPPPAHVSEPEHAAPAESHTTPNRDSNSNGNAHGASQFQDHDHGKIQDR